MDAVDSILLDALRTAAAHEGELRLYRSGKLPGLLPARTASHAAAAARALRDGLIEVVRTEPRGKATVEWVRVTPRGIDFVVQHDSPARALDELRDALRAGAEDLPAWVAAIRQEVDGLNRHVIGEVERIGRRLDRLAETVEAVLRRLEQQRPPSPLPWADAALDFLTGRARATGQERCPLPDLFAALRERQFELAIKDFHAGLRRLHERGQLRLLPHDGPDGAPAPEYALADGPAVLYYAAPGRAESGGQPPRPPDGRL